MLVWAGVCLILSLTTGYYGFKYNPSTSIYLARLFSYLFFTVFLILVIISLVSSTPHNMHEPIPAM